jgi:hypothetical protein
VIELAHDPGFPLECNKLRAVGGGKNFDSNLLVEHGVETEIDAAGCACAERFYRFVAIDRKLGRIEIEKFRRDLLEFDRLSRRCRLWRAPERKLAATGLRPKDPLSEAAFSAGTDRLFAVQTDRRRLELLIRLVLIAAAADGNPLGKTAPGGRLPGFQANRTMVAGLGHVGSQGRGLVCFLYHLAGGRNLR